MTSVEPLKSDLEKLEEHQLAKRFLCFICFLLLLKRISDCLQVAKARAWAFELSLYAILKNSYANRWVELRILLLVYWSVMGTMSSFLNLRSVSVIGFASCACRGLIASLTESANSCSAFACFSISQRICFVSSQGSFFQGEMGICQVSSDYNTNEYDA